jgi:hypothetical protein
VSDTTQGDMVPAEETQGGAAVSEAAAADVATTDIAGGEAVASEATAVVEEKPKPKSKGPVWRRTLAWVFLILGLVLLPLAVTGGWVRGNIFSTDGFVNMVGPLGSDPAVQQQVAVSATNQIFNALDLQTRLQNILPKPLGVIAGPLEDRLKARTLQGAEALTSSDQFATVWTTAIRGVHKAVVGFMNGTGKVYLNENGMITLDLSAISTPLVDRLAKAGIDISAQDRPILATGQVPIVQAAKLDKVRGLLNFVNKLFIVLPILAVLLLAGSVAVAVRRQRAAVRVGIGMMIAMAIFVLIIAIGRTFFMNATNGAGISTDAAGALWHALTIALRATAWGLFFIGLLLLIHPYIVRAFRGGTMERAAGGAAERGWDTGGFGRFLAHHRTMLALVVLIIGFLALVLSGGPPIWAIILTAVLVIIVDALIFFFARLSELATQARAEVVDESA